MSELSCGIVGLPNVGKSTLFNALTGAAAGASNFPFCTIEPNVGIVPVPDERLEQLAQKSQSQKIIPASVRFVDIAGLVKGASQGEGLGNKFLANIRETDAILQVVRCFESDDIIHVHGKIDPVKDAQIIGLELVMADLQMVDNILIKLSKQAKAKPELKEVLNILEKVKIHLDNGQPLRTLGLDFHELEQIETYNFLTSKPLMYVANVCEEDLAKPETNPHYQAIVQYAQTENAQVLPLCAELESQIAQLPLQEQKEMLEAMGLCEPGLDRLIRQSFDLLGLITYLTTGPQETRAWTITRGTKAPEAAGKIHTDIQKGFIKAEVIDFPEFIELGRQGAKDKGKARIEGRDYLVQDGDVILFHHAK